MNCPRVSIIVATWNSKNTIQSTIDSLLSQSYSNLEVIFVDGASTDGTLEIIRNCGLKNCKVICEPDRGIGDAWNKGVSVSTGDVIGFLNSDDFYQKNMIENIVPFFSHENSPLIGFGDVIVLDEDLGKQHLVKGAKRSKFFLLNGFGFLHPSVFFNRQAYEIVGPFDYSISIAVDTDWLLRAIRYKVPFKRIPSLVYMRKGGVSDKKSFTAMGEYGDALRKAGYSEFLLFTYLLFRCLGQFLRVVGLRK